MKTSDGSFEFELRFYPPTDSSIYYRCAFNLTIESANGQMQVAFSGVSNVDPVFALGQLVHELTDCLTQLVPDEPNEDLQC